MEDKKIDENRLLLSKLKDHVVQVEAMVTYVIICIVALYLIDHSGVHLPIWLVPSLFLIGLRQVVRVTNPTSGVRDALVWAGTIGGVAGAIVGAAADLMAGGLTGAQGTLIGSSAGAVAGGALGHWIESWGKKDAMVERGEAFDYLYKHRKKNPRVANAKLVDVALENTIPSFDKNQDGRKWYSVDDLDKFLQEPSKSV